MIQLETNSTASTATQELDCDLIRESVRDFVARNVDHNKIRSLRFRTPGYNTEQFRQMHELGWWSARIPEAYGGLGLGISEMVILLSELGRGLLAGPLAATAGLAVNALIHATPSSARDALLCKVSAGELMPALAWQEHSANLSVSECACSAEPMRTPGGSAIRLNGEKRLVMGATAAQVFLVTARTSKGVALYCVDASTPGLAQEHEWLADGTPATRLILNDVDIQASKLIIGPPDATEAIERAIDEAKVFASAELYGLMSHLLTSTLDYMKIRVQFDKPIGSFQALQHKAVDLFIQQELTASVLNEASDSIAGLDATQRAMLAARLKARASDAALKIAREAVQLHGAIAIQDECDVGLYLKRILVMAAWLGNASQQRKHYVRMSQHAA